MQRVIWSCWFQGRDSAPELVRKCLQSWEDKNPGWDFRCLDSSTVGRYVDLDKYVDLERQQITAASLSDLLRLLLLHEYGGVWVDATTFCNAPLDDWISSPAEKGFFAFARPAEGRELATWFIAAQAGNQLLAKWAARALHYWDGRTSSQDYFWVHHQFGELIALDEAAFAEWRNVPKISADGPHSVQTAGMYADIDDVRDRVDWSAPVFKLTHRLDEGSIHPPSLISELAGLHWPAAINRAMESKEKEGAHLPISHLRLKTENLGDHIQILAGERMLARAGLRPSQWVDRDDEIAEPPAAGHRTGILLNGWFKTNPAQWPPHPAYSPVYLGFHVRLFQSPSLLNAAALAHYRTHGPIGCRDRHTLSLLRSRGVEAFVSHCLTLGFPRRLPDPTTQTEVFVVSRDRELLKYLPEDVQPYQFISHYSGTGDFAANMTAAHEILETYRTRAKLIVTSMLHCALPAIAMGIPVVVLYPPNDEAGRESDKQRFSSLSDIIRVFELSEVNLIDWRGCCPDVSNIKLRLIDSFFRGASRWGRLPSPRIEGFAPAAVLPVPEADDGSYFEDLGRFQRLGAAQAPDRQKWGRKSSYRPEWADRSKLAAQFVDDGEAVLEIGAGTGTFRALVADRCNYVGTDLQPVNPDIRALNLEYDPLPAGSWDTIVLLGVLEYIHRPSEAMAKVFAKSSKVVMSYCFPSAGGVEVARQSRGWVSSLSEAELLQMVRVAGFQLTTSAPFNHADDFEQRILVFQREKLVEPAFGDASNETCSHGAANK